MRCRTGMCEIRLFRRSRPKGPNDDDVQMVLLVSIRHNAQFNACMVMPYSAMLFFSAGEVAQSLTFRCCYLEPS